MAKTPSGPTLRASASQSVLPPDIPGYRITSHLGEGGMGSIFLAEETALGRRVAIKIVSHRIAGDAQSTARFLREARTLATIEHPHVVRVYSFGEVGGSPYLVMEYIEGETLAERLSRAGRLPVDDALRVTRQIVDALETAWERKIVHRDIKPSNILLDRRNQVHVADFGLAKPTASVSDASLTASNAIVGTPHYVSPEQAQGKEVDFRSDVYSLGIMLYQMITGERPFEGSTPVAVIAKHLQEPLPSLTAKRPDAGVHLERLVQALTEKDPERRPSSYAKILEMIDALRTPTPSQPLRTLSTIPMETVRSRPKAGLIAGAAAMLVVIAIIAVWFMRSPAKRQEQSPAAPSDSRLVVAVAPFYGPDDNSAREGRVMASLIERAIENRLGTSKVVVLGIDETKSAVHSHDAARELGEKLHANAVIWGEAFALQRETEIQPHVTILQKQPSTSTTRSMPRSLKTPVFSATGDVEALEAHTGGGVKLLAEAPNQLELRKTSASGLGDVVVTLAAMHALDQGDAKTALEFLEQSPVSPQTLRLRVDALLRLHREGDARSVLERAIALDINHAPSQALLGDFEIEAGRLSEAATAYGKAAALQQPYTTTRGFVQDGTMYVTETFRSRLYTSGVADEPSQTLFLIAIDPKSQRVLTRYLLPGLAQQFTATDDGVKITLDVGAQDPLLYELHFAHGKFSSPLSMAPNLLWRVRTSKAGRAIATNFMSGLEGMRDRNEPYHGTFALSALVLKYDDVLHVSHS